MRERLVRLAKKHSIALRQSYARVGKFALIQQPRYAHAKQFRRAKRSLKTLKTQLGRGIRGVVRKIKGQTGYHLFTNPVVLTPYGAVQAVNFEGPGYNEYASTSGSNFALSYNGQSATQTTNSDGFRTYGIRQSGQRTRKGDDH